MTEWTKEFWKSEAVRMDTEKKDTLKALKEYQLFGLLPLFAALVMGFISASGAMFYFTEFWIVLGGIGGLELAKQIIKGGKKK